MFQLKNFVSIAASMLNYVRSTTGKVTDLQPGSVTRTILEAPASEIEELYLQMFNGIKEAIPVAVYNSIKFDKLPAQYASGRVTVTAKTAPAQALSVPTGTRFLTPDGRAYVTVKDATWPAGQKQFVFPVIATIAGVNQNAAADQIVSSPAFPPDQYNFNSTAMVNGSDVETDDSRNIRFANYISALSRGTEAALLYGASTGAIKDEAGNIIESVSRTSLTSLTGSVMLYIWGSNGEPSMQLQNAVTTIIEGSRDSKGNVTAGYVAAGISCTVKTMALHPVNAAYKVSLADGYTLTDQLKTSIRNALDNRLYAVMTGETITAEDMRVAILSISGIMTAQINGVDNIVCGAAEVLGAGTVTVDEIVIQKPTKEPDDHCETTSPQTADAE